MNQHNTKKEEPIIGKIQFWSQKNWVLQAQGGIIIGLDTNSILFYNLQVLDEGSSASVPRHIFTMGNSYISQICHDSFCK